jgi:hypothetical protein
MWAAEPLEVRLSASCAHRPVITFLMIHGHLRPGYDYLLERKISSLWRERKCRIPRFGFPAPFGPRNPVTRPGRMEKDRSLTATVEP